MLKALQDDEKLSLHARFDPFWHATYSWGSPLKVLVAAVVLSAVSFCCYYPHWIIAGSLASAFFALGLSNPPKQESLWTETNPKGTFTEKTKRAALVLTVAPLLGAFAGQTYPDSWHGPAIAALAPAALVLGAVAMHMQASATYATGGATRYKFD